MTSRSSPWYSYLQHVYKDEQIPLPVNLSSFEFFYLALLPVEWRCRADDQTVARQCAQEECTPWLHPAEPSKGQLARHARLWGVRSFQWQRSRFKRLLWNQTLRFIPRNPSESLYRRPFIEVTRHSKLFSGWYDWCARGSSVRNDEWVGNQNLGAAEGVQYGCWFTPSVGTGVFLPTGRQLYLVDRLEAEQRLPEILRFPLVHQNTSFATRGEGQYVTIHHKDCLYATATRDRGFDTLFIENNPEGAPHVIVPSAGCMQRTEPLQTGCAPTDVGLRTGWRGDRTCACDDAHGDAEGLATVLNCAST